MRMPCWEATTIASLDDPKLQRVTLNSVVEVSVVSLSVNGAYMAFPTKTCVVCGEEFELKPDKPGFANRCPECSTPDATAPATQRRMDADERKSLSEANEARRQAMRQLLYRKDS